MKFTNKNTFDLNNFKLDPRSFFEQKKEVPAPLIIDIRTAEEYEKEHIGGSQNLPLAHLENNMMQLPPFGAILVYSDGKDTGIAEAIEMMFNNGFTEMLFVEGGYPKIVESMILFSDEAKALALEMTASQNSKGILVRIKGRDCEFSFVGADENPDATEADFWGVPIFLDVPGNDRLEGTSFYVEAGELKIDTPVMRLPRLEGGLSEEIQKILDDEINPNIAMHGGVISLIEIKEDTMYIEMGGGCQGCGMANVTLKQGVETTIRSKVPEISRVLDVTDHDGGSNPYYQPSAK